MWEQSVVEYEFDDGWRIIRPVKKAELETLGNIQGHCSGHHSFWTDPKHMHPYHPLEYMFVLVDPEDNPRITAHCKLDKYVNKKHPKEDACKRSGVNRYGGDYIHSTYYDGAFRRGNAFGYDLAYYEARVRDARRYYEQYKERALEYGPLGRDNPYKYEVDGANRQIQAAEKQLHEYKQNARFNTGTRFMCRGRKIAVIHVTGRGVDFNSKKSYVDRFLEFAGEVENA